MRTEIIRVIGFLKFQFEYRKFITEFVNTPGGRIPSERLAWGCLSCYRTRTD